MKLIDWVGLIALIFSLVILWQFRQILLLVFTATVLAIAINSLVRLLVKKFDLKRSWALVSALLIGFVGIIGFIGIVVPPFVGQFQQLVELVPQGIDQLQEVGDDILLNLPPWLPQPSIEDLPNFSEVAQQLGTIVRQVFGNFFGFFSGSVAVVLQLLLLSVLTLMFVSEPQNYRSLLLRLFPSFYRRRADHILSRCETSLLNWLAGMSLSSLFVAGCSGISLFILGIPLAFTHALLAGVSNLIPNIGPTLSVVFPVAVALINSPSKAILVVVVYLIIQNLEAYWFSPLVMRQQVSLLPAATLVAQIFFASFLGPLGLLLAIPLAVVVKIWIEEAVIKDVLDQMKKPRWRSPFSSSLEAPQQDLPADFQQPEEFSDVKSSDVKQLEMDIPSDKQIPQETQPSES
ncbi:MAG: AI-2E family transporter [Cyanobacteria bacterium J06627_8]